MELPYVLFFSKRLLHVLKVFTYFVANVTRNFLFVINKQLKLQNKHHCFQYQAVFNAKTRTVLKRASIMQQQILPTKGCNDNKSELFSGVAYF